MAQDAFLDVIEIPGRLTTPAGRAKGVVNQGRSSTRNTPWTHYGFCFVRDYVDVEDRGRVVLGKVDPLSMGMFVSML